MGIHGIENITKADEGFTVYITDDNHQWVSEMTGLSLDDIYVLWVRAKEQGTQASVNVAQKPDHC